MKLYQVVARTWYYVDFETVAVPLDEHTHPGPTWRFALLALLIDLPADVPEDLALSWRDFLLWVGWFTFGLKDFALAEFVQLKLNDWAAWYRQAVARGDVFNERASGVTMRVVGVIGWGVEFEPVEPPEYIVTYKDDVWAAEPTGRGYRGSSEWRIGEVLDFKIGLVVRNDGSIEGGRDSIFWQWVTFETQEMPGWFRLYIGYSADVVFLGFLTRIAGDKGLLNFGHEQERVKTAVVNTREEYLAVAGPGAREPPGAYPKYVVFRA